MQTDVRAALAELIEVYDAMGCPRGPTRIMAETAIAASPQAEMPVAYLCSITHPDWLEVCERDSPGAFPVYASPKPAQAEPEGWADVVEQRLLTWRQRFVNRSGDQLALDDFMGQESIDDLVDFVCSPIAAAPKRTEG